MTLKEWKMKLTGSGTGCCNKIFNKISIIIVSKLSVIELF